MIHDDVLGTIGRTPIVRLNRIPKGAGAQIIFNVSASPWHLGKSACLPSWRPSTPAPR